MPVPERPRRPLPPLATALAACVLAAAGCSSTSAPPAPAAAPAAASPAAGVAALTVTDPWVKASDPAMGAAMAAPTAGASPSGPPMAAGMANMTAVFGTLTVTGTTPVTIESASTSASPRTELHEVVEEGDASLMRVKPGGFEVAPGAPHVLAPGGDHIMIMDMPTPIRAGDQVQVTLRLSDGSTTSFAALAKETTGGQENYESGDGGHDG